MEFWSILVNLVNLVIPGVSPGAILEVFPGVILGVILGAIPGLLI